MKEYIDKLKEIETLVELSIGTTMTEEKATDIYAVTNDLMCKVKKLNIPAVRQQSELLKAFADYYNSDKYNNEMSFDTNIDNFLKAFNCA